MNWFSTRSPAKRLGALLGILSALVMITAGTYRWDSLTAALTGGEDENQYPILGACGRDEQLGLFPEIAPGDLEEGQEDIMDAWSKEYNTRVDEVVEEYLEMDGSESEIDCLSDSLETLLPAGDKMLDLASELPPWEDPGDKDQLSFMDTYTVLLEYLRTYECALTGRYFYLFGDVLKEMRSVAEEDDVTLWWSNVFREFAKQERKIRHELEVTRPSLNRLIFLLNGYGRMRPLEMEVECFYRASMDFRNAIAASAEASACLPRTWDAKDPMRDLK